VQLQNAKQKFEAQGLKLAAISYDSPAILKDFAERHNIDFPLLADPNSEIINRFHVLNAQAKGMNKGMAFPGFFFAHLRLTLAQSDRSVIPGARVSLIADVELPPDVHVYSPEVQGYKPIQLNLQEQAGIEFQPVSYPSSKVLYLEAIKEHVPVFDGKFRISQDVTVTPSKELVSALASGGKTIAIAGELKYQACDKTVCFPPSSVPVKWQLQILPLDMKRSPEAIRHK